MGSVGAVQGLLLRASIYDYQPGSSKAKIYIESLQSSPNYGSNAKIDSSNLIDAFVPLSWSGINGEFIGGYPANGNRVVVSQGQGGEWFILSYLPFDTSFNNNNTITQSSLVGNKLVNLQDGRFLFQTEPNNYIFSDKKNKIGIRAGGLNNFIQINPYQNIISHNFNQEYSFTQANRSIKGIIKRDISPNSMRDVKSSMLDSQDYDNTLENIRMDPFSIQSPGGTFPRNAPFSESREVVYEFAEDYRYTNDQDESEKYSSNYSSDQGSFINRHKSRADALSLNLNEANQLIETIKGTCVDIYGNILDLNRNPLLIGKKEKLSLKNNADKKQAFLNIREQLRKSIAYHFEINTRKSVNIPDVNSEINYKRDRSRFFIDIDKEGQFKLNVPASSEVGNIAFLSRYENYSVISNKKKGGAVKATEFLRNPINKDIFADTFADSTPINVKSGDKDLDGYEAPIDRFTSKPMQYGTVFHDISKVLFYRNQENPLEKYDTDKISGLSNDTVYASLYKRPIVTQDIIVSGDKANAGGRSGTLNFDGSLVFNIGANTADRQSMWLDCAGGMISTLGRDLNGISHAVNADGDINIFIGGPTINKDTRFKTSTNGVPTVDNGDRVGNLDIRVWSPNGPTIVRISGEAVSVATPGRLDIIAKQSIAIKSINGNLDLYGQNIHLYADANGNARLVARNGLPVT